MSELQPISWANLASRAFPSGAATVAICHRCDAVRVVDDHDRFVARCLAEIDGLPFFDSPAALELVVFATEHGACPGLAIGRLDLHRAAQPRSFVGVCEGVPGGPPCGRLALGYVRREPRCRWHFLVGCHALEGLARTCERARDELEQASERLMEVLPKHPRAANVWTVLMLALSEMECLATPPGKQPPRIMLVPSLRREVSSIARTSRWIDVADEFPARAECGTAHDTLEPGPEARHCLDGICARGLRTATLGGEPVVMCACACANCLCADTRRPGERSDRR